MYEIVVERRAEKEIRKIPDRDIQRIEKVIDGFEQNPRPHGSLKLTNQPGYRYRVGDYRILYKIDDERRRVTVFRVKRRSESTYKE